MPQVWERFVEEDDQAYIILHRVHWSKPCDTPGGASILGRRNILVRIPRDPCTSLDPLGVHPPLRRTPRQHRTPHAPLLRRGLWGGEDRAIRGQRLRALGSRLHRLPVGKDARLAPTRPSRPSYPNVAVCVRPTNPPLGRPIFGRRRSRVPGIHAPRSPIFRLAAMGRGD